MRVSTEGGVPPPASARKRHFSHRFTLISRGSGTQVLHVAKAALLLSTRQCVSPRERPRKCQVFVRSFNTVDAPYHGKRPPCVLRRLVANTAVYWMWVESAGAQSNRANVKDSEGCSGKTDLVADSLLGWRSWVPLRQKQVFYWRETETDIYCKAKNLPGTTEPPSARKRF